MSQRRSLSPAQIKYFKISPKLLNPGSEMSRKAVDDALLDKIIETDSQVQQAGIKKIAKGTFGHFEMTVRNFGVLMNKNFGQQSTHHQVQKFGSRVKKLNDFMISGGGSLEDTTKKNALMQKIKDRSDGRTFIKAIFQKDEVKIFASLKSFELEILHPNKGSQGLPIPYLKFLLDHVNSSRLIMVIEGALQLEGNQIAVDYEKIENKAKNYDNKQMKYQEGGYEFERLGQQLKIVPPCLQLIAPDINFKQTITIDNNDIMQIVETNFGNVQPIIDKYLDKHQFDRCLKQHHD